VLSYGLRLNAALLPFVVPVLVIAGVALFLTGHRADAAWCAALAAAEAIGYVVTRFWLSTIAEQDARDWQQRYRDVGESE
jgi:hypothetical protein